MRQDETGNRAGKDERAGRFGKDDRGNRVGKDERAGQFGKDDRGNRGGKDDKGSWVGKDDRVKRAGKDERAGRFGKDDSTGRNRDGAGRKPSVMDSHKGGAVRRQDGTNHNKGGVKPCPVASKCGGCRWIGREYAEQLKAKETAFRKLMEPYAKPEPIVGMEDPTHYRNKVHAVFGEDRKHGIISGTYEEKSHRIVPVDSCLIEDRKADEIIVSIRGLLKSFKIRPYNEDTGCGLFRHVLVRTGHATGQVMVVLVLSAPVLPSKNNFVKALLKLHPEITTVVLNVNERDTSMVLGEREQVLYGRGYIEDELCGKTFRISPKSFYQVNPAQAEKLYRKAVEYAGLTGKEILVDAYCGTGTIGIAAADRAEKVLGVELNPDAVRDARANAKRNQVTNAEFYRNDAGKFLAQMAEQGGRADVVLLDPPRSGSTQEFLDAVAKVGAKRVVYVSCEPETLVRDVKYLKKKGYAVQRCVAVDMFPYTECTEAVCLLVKTRAGGGKAMDHG